MFVGNILDNIDDDPLLTHITQSLEDDVIEVKPNEDAIEKAENISTRKANAGMHPCVLWRCLLL